jgi:AcrR family transcriptional regulator
MNERSLIMVSGGIMATTRQERKENITRMRQQQILDAALVAFTEKGFAAATTTEIANLAGVAEGTIYNYFPNKRELFIAVIRNAIITEPMLDLIKKLPKEDFGVTFKQIMQNRINLVESGPMSRFPSLMGEIQRDPELKALWVGQFIQPLLSQFEDIYREGAASGEMRSLEPAVIVRAIGGMIIGFIMLKMMEGEASPLNRLPQEKVAEDIMTIVLHGLLDEQGAERAKQEKQK